MDQTARRRAATPDGVVRALLAVALIVGVGGPVCVLTHVLSTGGRPSTNGMLALGVWLGLIASGLAALPGRRAVAPSARLASLAGAVALLGGQGLLAFWPQASPDRACLPVMGRGARLGIELALLRQDPACPAGTLSPTSVVGATYGLVCLALALIAVHAVTAVLLGVAAAALLRALVLGVLRLYDVTRPRIAGPDFSAPRPPAAGRASALTAGRVAAARALRRGPPSASCA